MTFILFPSFPLSDREIDPDYLPEFEAARKAGFKTGFVSIENLIDGNGQKTVARLPKQMEEVTCIYRGWMLTAVQYASLYSALKEKGYLLQTTPEKYQRCHEFPGGYEIVGDLMPKSEIFPLGEEFSPEDIQEKAARVFSGEVIVKDYVKSRKHEWFDACYIKDITNTSDAIRVLKNFIERQGDALQGGVVIREYIPLKPIGLHPKSNMPIPLEYRCFFHRGKSILSEEYWHELEYENPVQPPEELIMEIANEIKSPFFTADFAMGMDEKWYLIELGDGQVSQIPEKASLDDFYSRIH